MQLTHPVPLKNGVASGQGTVSLDGLAASGFDVKVRFNAAGAVPFGV